MNKYFKLMLVIMTSCFILCERVDAGTKGFLSVTLPKLSTNSYISSLENRDTTLYPQEYYNTRTIDNMDNKEIKMVANVCSSSGNSISSVTLDTGQTGTFGGKSIYTGNYKMKLRRKKTSLWTAVHSGVWTY